MTRDEAIEIKIKSARAGPFDDIPDKHVRMAAAAAIDGYVALGILKLDEPSTAKKLASCLQEIGIGVDWGPIEFALKKLGLEIVDAKYQNARNYNPK